MTDTRIVSVGSPVPSPMIVSADQQTIFGDGTAQAPLRADASAGTGLTLIGRIIAQEETVSRVGQAVCPSGSDPGIRTFAMTQASAQSVSQPTSIDAQVIGILVAFPFEDAATVQINGQANLTTGQWDLITGGSGGLEPGDAYYLSAVPSEPGRLTNVAPSSDGTFVVQVGVALNPTTMQLSTPATPSFNSGT